MYNNFQSCKMMYSEKIKFNYFEKMIASHKHKILEIVILIGNILTVLGCGGLVLGLFGLFSFDSVAFGLSSGIRIVGLVAISGCMLNAIGHGILDYSKN